jgi:predicted esterase
MTVHEGQQVLRGGASLKDARAALILLHGRGATAEDIYSLGEEIAGDLPNLALLAPQASANTWYPQRFFAPLEQNEPYLSSALGVISGLVASLEKAGIGGQRIMLVGFSQGACLALEYAARNPMRYGGVIGLSGALIGPPGSPRKPVATLGATPVYLGCSDRDPHIPLASVEESAQILARMGGAVTKSIFPGMGHTVNEEELSFATDLAGRLAKGV